MADPGTEDASIAEVAHWVDEATAQNAVFALSVRMNEARAPGWTGPRYVMIRSDVPPKGCTPHDEACVWRFGVHPVQENEPRHWRELCEVHAYRGTVRCGNWRLRAPAEQQPGDISVLVWNVVGNAHAVPAVDAAGD